MIYKIYEKKGSICAYFYERSRTKDIQFEANLFNKIPSVGKGVLILFELSSE